MSKKIKLFLAFFVILALSTTAVIFAAGATYDSESDPLVSLSFLTEIFKPELQEEIRISSDNVELMLQAQIDSLTSQVAFLTNKLALLTEKLEKVTDSTTSAPTVTPDTSDPDTQTYTVLTLKQGDILLAEGDCELVLRLGSATVTSSSVERILLDCTDGIALIAGASVPQNHFILIPIGADGRGITVTSESASVMIKGAYSIVEK